MSSSYWRETEGPKFCHLGKVTWQCSVWLLNPKIVLNYMPLSHSRNDKTGTISIMPQYWNHYFRPMFEKNAFQKYLKSLTLYDIDNSGKETNRHKVPMLIFSMQSEAGLFGCRWLKPLQTVLGPKGGIRSLYPQTEGTERAGQSQPETWIQQNSLHLCFSNEGAHKEMKCPLFIKTVIEGWWNNVIPTSLSATFVSSWKDRCFWSIMEERPADKAAVLGHQPNSPLIFIAL